jgi:hypothetical protein
MPVRIHYAAVAFVIGCVPLWTQTVARPAPNIPTESFATATPAESATTVPAAVTDTKIGFSSSLPQEWQGIAPVQKQIDVPYPAAVGPKKGDACVEVKMTARHVNSESVIVALALPFDCYGQTMKEDDLKDFGEGVAEGLKQTFAIFKQAQGSYSLGSHEMWIERADGTPKRIPEIPATFEIACTVLHKGAVCWMTMASDASSLRDFEHQAVTLEGDAFDALVPAGVALVIPEIPVKKSP